MCTQGSWASQQWGSWLHHAGAAANNNNNNNGGGAANNNNNNNGGGDAKNNKNNNGGGDANNNKKNNGAGVKPVFTKRFGGCLGVELAHVTLHLVIACVSCACQSAAD